MDFRRFNGGIDESIGGVEARMLLRSESLRRRVSSSES
jgi:hypothetical protein